MKWLKQGLIFCPDKTYDWMSSHAAVPFAERVDQSVYKVFFSARDEKNRSQVGFFLVDIENPNRILAVSQEPVLGIGNPGAFDDSGAMLSWIVDDGVQKYLYYIGWNLGITVPFRNAIGLALSSDGGQTYTKYSEGPILDRSIHDPFFTASSCVLIEPPVWHMWYVSCSKWTMEPNGPKHYYHIRYARSHDGINWTPSGTICVGFQSQEEYAISRPCVLKDGDTYRMWYSYRGTSYRIGYAESLDGMRWNRRDEEAGIDVSASGWDSEMIEYPFVFDHDGKRYLLYNGNGYGKTGIGLAIAD